MKRPDKYGVRLPRRVDKLELDTLMGQVLLFQRSGKSAREVATLLRNSLKGTENLTEARVTRIWRAHENKRKPRR